MNLWATRLLAALSVAIFLTPLAAWAQGRPVEEFGVKGFRRDFFGTLTVTPFAADPAITEGAGHSRVTCSGPDKAFDPSWPAESVEFVAYRVHKNPAEVTAEAFFPAVIGCRYSKVVRVIDDHNLIVNFEYNGGSPAAPKTSEKVSGYFFIDCAPALRKMVEAPDRPETFVFESGRQYVVKGMPNIPFLAKGQAGDMRWTSSLPQTRAAIKISAEDAISFRERNKPSAIPDGTFFQLNAHDHSIFLDNLDIIGPTYTVPTVEGAWDGVMFAYANGQCARTLEIRNCNTFAEKMDYAQRKIALPDGATWVAPGITGIVGGGGKRGDRGDGVVDMLDYQRFNLIRSTWVARDIHSIKNNDGAGNWITIDGVDLDEKGMPVHMVYEATYVKRNRFDGVMVSFHNFDGPGARRGVRIESNDFSWRMLTNQYWTGGTSTSSTAPCEIEVSGVNLFFGNNGDWRRESKDPRPGGGYINASEALLFERIPQVGDRVPLEKDANGAVRVWGWGVQKGDVLSVGGRDFEIADLKRKFTDGPIFGEHKGGYAHYLEATFKQGALPEGAELVGLVKRSRTAVLLDGRPRKVNLVYNRDLHGHWQYNRAEVNYEFRNICFTGNYRQTAGPAKGGEEYEGLWELPTTMEWVNCWAMQTDGSERGKPAYEVRSEAFNKSTLRQRNEHPDSKKRDHHILVDGGWLFAQRASEKQSPLWIRNRPALIYGSASFGEPRICNPVMLDNKGIISPAAGVSISLVGGYTLDLSNSIIGDATAKGPVNLNIYGNGTVILDNVRFNEVLRGKTKASGALLTSLANGLQKDRFALHIKGKGGVGGVRLLGDPEDGSLHLTEWRLKVPNYSQTPVSASPGWKALPDFEKKVTVNGKPLAP